VDFLASMPKTDRLSGCTGRIGLGFVECERTPEEVIEVDIRLHLAGVSLIDTK
jgi:hypothetical protein